MKIKNKFSLYHFELYHFIVILVIIVLSQILIPIINNRSVDRFLSQTVEFYRWDVAERIADQTTASMELLFQRIHETHNSSGPLRQATIEALDMIFFQQKLQRSVADFSIIIGKGTKASFYDDGIALYDAVINKKFVKKNGGNLSRPEVSAWYSEVSGKLYAEETIQYKQKENQEFLFLIPFSFRGEVTGALYMKINPGLGVVESSALNSFRQSGLLFSGFIILGLLGIFLMTTYLLKERDQAQELLYQKREQQLTRQIEDRKEAMFVRRIYHAHHKVEKIIGFAKEDLRKWPKDIFPEISGRVNKYISFIGRVIYGMKTSNPPVQVIRNPMFNTDVNKLLRFIVDNIFRRVYREGEQYRFVLSPDKNCPAIHINEYVAWEIFEPLINNSIDHNKDGHIIIEISSRFVKEENQIIIKIADNGRGIEEEFLKEDKMGIKKIFRENISSKEITDNSGFGCYIAYENCRRCGWNLQAGNSKQGAVFTIFIPVN